MGYVTFKKEAFAAAVSQTMEARGDSTRDVEALTGIDKATVWRAQAGKAVPSAETFAALSMYAGIEDLWTFFEHVGTPAVSPAVSPDPVTDEVATE